MKFKFIIRKPFAGFVVIGVMIAAFVFIEYLASRKELIQTLSNEAENLTESLSASFENTIKANTEFENLLTDKLNAIALLVSGMDHHSQSFKDKIAQLNEQFNIESICILNTNAEIISKSGEHCLEEISVEIRDELAPLINGEYDWLNLGIVNISENEAKYLFARRVQNENLIVLIVFNPDYIYKYRIKTGIGTQIQKIGKSKNIEYIVLQDQEGIISASKGIKEMASIEADEFINNAYKSKGITSRMTDYSGRKVFEAMKILSLKDNSKILLRLALSTSVIRSIQQRAMIRVVIIGIGVYLLLSLFYFFIITRRGFSALKAEHRKITSYTDTVLENMADAVIAADAQNIILYFNRSAEDIFSIKAVDIIGKAFGEVFGQHEDIMNVYSNNEDVKNREIDFQAENGIIKILNINKSSIFSADLQPELNIVLINDLTESKHFQAQIQRNEKLSAMGELAAGVAHEIRNPLNAINIIAQRIHKEFKPNENIEEFDKFMKTIRSEIIRVNNIIQQFLEFARPKKLNLIFGKPSDQINECIALFESEAEMKNVSFEKDYEFVPNIYYDSEKIKQVFINIFRNSLDSIQSGGKIICRVRHDGQSNLKITIEDNGSGIAKNLLSKIFNLYFTTKSSGTGLGLSIVHQIITEHQGNINIISEENKGTAVIIELPLNLMSLLETKV